MVVLRVFWRILRFPIHPCFFALLIMIGTCVILQYQFYGEWLVRYPLFFLILAFLVLVTYNRFGQDFGLSHLFWHEKAWIQFRMGRYVSLLLALQWGISYEILRDFDGNQRFRDMASFRDRALAIPHRLTTSTPQDGLDAATLKEAGLEPLANPKGPFQWWPIDTNEERVRAHLKLEGRSAHPPPADQEGGWIGSRSLRSVHRWARDTGIISEEGFQIGNRSLLFCGFTYLPSLALLALAVFPPLVPYRRGDESKEEFHRRIQGMRGADKGFPFVWGMLSAAAIVCLLIVPCSMIYAWSISIPALQAWAAFFKYTSVSIGGPIEVPLFAIVFGLVAVTLLLNHWNTGGHATKLEYVILSLLGVTALLTIVQLRVWFPDPSSGEGQPPRIADWRAVEMILNILVLTTIISAVFFKMKYAYRDRGCGTAKSRDCLTPITSQGSICIMLAFFSVAYGSCVQLFWLADVEGMPIVQGVLAIPFVAFLLWRNSDRFKMRFPGMADYYERNQGNPNAVRLQECYQRNVTGDDRNAEDRVPLHENLEVLENWRKVLGDQPDEGQTQPKPKLAIVAVSGGSIRSGVWTAKVLTALEQAIPGFPHHVRLITGASGGMIGASLYAADLEPPEPGAADRKRDDDRLEKLVQQLNHDCLNRVVCQLALGDLPAVFSDRPQLDDRGHALEQAWDELSNGVLSKPFEALAEGELQGWRPSLVFTPMLAEDGRRLLIGNLDLKFLTRSEGPFLLDKSSRWLAENEKAHPRDDLYSLSAYQFFRLFPKARKEFKLSTAIRMSASFPYISPAVSLPTVPARRVVDAGYYDNYGINIAMSWVARHRQWLLENTSGFVLIQVRAFDSPRGIETAERTSGPLSSSSSLDSAIHWLTTPLKAALQARSAGMSFRNDEQIAAIANWFGEQEDEQPNFFQTVSFECDATASLNWYITTAEFNEIVARLTPGTKNWERLKALKSWWYDGQADRAAEPGTVEGKPSQEPNSRNVVPEGAPSGF